MFIETISNEELNRLEYASFPGKIIVIDSVGAEFNRAIAYLRSQKVIGFDTETRPCFSPNQPRYGVSLLQLSGPEKAFLFRVKNMGMHRRLCNLLSDDRIIKAGAAVHDDIRGPSEDSLGIWNQRQERQEDGRNNPRFPHIQDPAAFKLGGWHAFRVAVPLCSDRCVGMP